MKKIDNAAYQARLQRMLEMFSGIADQADEVSKERCPYMNKSHLCTAIFHCKNQRPSKINSEKISCTHDGAFDYRLAWESRPEKYEQVRERLKKIRSEAERKRAIRS
ncbi:MAG: hypothetical protein CL783_00165 [Chloroflexi bacterium]|mgnify:FL=1|nr:hypothetical protein [Chloroflexota bacterium]|tara:strand:+ start:5049 stop:5369 length:321 start_codon:yes stop_codon:yes gene_type:complete